MSDGLYFPTIESGHWFVFLVDIKYHNFIFLDSYFGEDSSYHKKIATKMINNFQKTWYEAGLKQMNFEIYGRAYPIVPKQTTPCVILLARTVIIVFKGERHHHLSKNVQNKNVPCFARRSLTQLQTIICMWRQKKKIGFVSVLDKHKHKTRIHGGDYQDFLLNYNMDRGDRIKLDMNNKPPYLLIYPPDKYGNAKERVLEFVFKDTARAIVYSKNFNPTASEIARMNIAAVNHGIGVGAVYVHTITKSDIAQNMMHIPKIITSLLKIPRSGKARLVMAENKVVTQAEYFKSTDGRLRFKKGWTEFAVKCKLGTGVRVLIMFDMVAKKLVVYFDVVRY